MKAWRFYHRVTGVISPACMLLPNQAHVDANTPADHAAIYAELDHRTQRIDVDSGLPVPFDAPTNPATLAARARERRDQLLAACDWVVLRAGERGEPVPLTWITYREALRAVPSQTAFPIDIQWPEPPNP